MPQFVWSLVTSLWFMAASTNINIWRQTAPRLKTRTHNQLSHLPENTLVLHVSEMREGAPANVCGFLVERVRTRLAGSRRVHRDEEMQINCSRAVKLQRHWKHLRLFSHTNAAAQRSESAFYLFPLCVCVCLCVCVSVCVRLCVSLSEWTQECRKSQECRRCSTGRK